MGGKLDAGKVERDLRHIHGAIPPDGFPDGNAAPALELLAEPVRVLKKTRSSRPKDKTANLSDVSHSARLDRSHRPPH